MFVFAVTPDPVDEYLEETSRIGHKRAQNCGQSSTSKTDLTTACPATKKQKRCRGGRRSRLRSSQDKTTDKTQDSDDIKKKVTCGQLPVFCSISLIFYYLCIYFYENTQKNTLLYIVP